MRGFDDGNSSYGHVGDGNPLRGRCIVGTQIGYDRELGGRDGMWIIGFEGDADYGDRSMGAVFVLPVTAICRFPAGAPIPPPPGFGCAPAPQTTNARAVETRGDVSVRFRGGAIWGGALIYATAGLSIANTSLRAEDRFVTLSSLDAALHCSATDPPCIATGRKHENRIGWTAGFGGELPLDDKFSIAAEYRHSDYGSHAYGFKTSFAGNGAQVLSTLASTSISLNDDRVTLRLNYRFGGA